MDKDKKTALKEGLLTANRKAAGFFAWLWLLVGSYVFYIFVTRE